MATKSAAPRLNAGDELTSAGSFMPSGLTKLSDEDRTALLGVLSPSHPGNAALNCTACDCACDCSCSCYP